MAVFGGEYDTRCYFNVRSKADMSQLILPHGIEKVSAGGQMSGQGLIAIRKTRSAIMDVVSNSAFYKCRPTAQAATPRQRENIKDFNRRRRRRENIMANGHGGARMQAGSG